MSLAVFFFLKKKTDEQFSETNTTQHRHDQSIMGIILCNHNIMIPTTLAPQIVYTPHKQT